MGAETVVRAPSSDPLQAGVDASMRRNVTHVRPYRLTPPRSHPAWSQEALHLGRGLGDEQRHARTAPQPKRPVVEPG